MNRSEMRETLAAQVENIEGSIAFAEGVVSAAEEAIGMLSDLGASSSEIEIYQHVVEEQRQALTGYHQLLQSARDLQGTLDDR